MDGNTRLCTATAARGLIESFGTDGQPGSYTDIDHADAFLLAGHNMASQQTVLWVADPRPAGRPEPAEARRDRPADDRDGQQADGPPGPPGRDQRRGHQRPDPPDHRGRPDRPRLHRAAHHRLREARGDRRRSIRPSGSSRSRGSRRASSARRPRILGSAPRLISTVLQGFYQSNQASAAAVQVNNLHLIRGMIGKPGCTVLQMNGQPTAENTRECGCDGEMPALPQLGQPRPHRRTSPGSGTSSPTRSPTGPRRPTPCRSSGTPRPGSIRFLWVVATNPAVSMPDLPPDPRDPGQGDLFLVVQDAFLTETAEFADVVLPAALWGEKTGTFTNVDRTVHLTRKADRAPRRGPARPRHLPRLRPPDGLPRQGRRPADQVVRPRGGLRRLAANARRGRPCDYSGMTYAKLSPARASSGPATTQFPDGAERLYTDGKFNTRLRLLLGLRPRPRHRRRDRPSSTHKATDPVGRAILKSVDYMPPVRGARRRLPVLAHHRPGRLPLPHPDQDRPRRPS